jgi:hypothetical protein
MNRNETADDAEPSFRTRAVRVALSVVLLVPVTVFLGYGGWLVLTIAGSVGVYEPRNGDSEPLRDRLLAWPERNREVMRTDGQVELPLRP